MRKVIFIAAALVICFTLSASAATTLVLEPDSINMEADTGSVVIYTSAFGDTILSGEINDEHGFRDFYALTVVPKMTNNNASGDASEEKTSSEGEADLSNDILNSSAQEDVISSEDASDVIPPVIPSESADFVAETATASDYRYKIQAVYNPGTADKDIAIPENGFVIVFPASKLGDVSDGDIAADAPVALFGIDLEKPEISDGAYVEIDISEKGLLGDIPQTSDDGRIALFAVLAIFTAGALVKLYSIKRSRVL